MGISIFLYRNAFAIFGGLRECFTHITLRTGEGSYLNYKPIYLNAWDYGINSNTFETLSFTLHECSYKFSFLIHFCFQKYVTIASFFPPCGVRKPIVSLEHFQLQTSLLYHLRNRLKEMPLNNMLQSLVGLATNTAPNISRCYATFCSNVSALLLWYI